MTRRFFIVSLLSVLFFGGSASAQQTGGSSGPGGERGAPSRVYNLAPNDVVMMKVYQEDDLQSQVRVGKDGMVTLPLLGPVRIGGKTLEEATSVITALFDDGYLVNPQVSLTIVEYGKRRFTVLGQVQRPGTYEMPAEEGVTLLQAISMAGGYTRIGAPWKVTLQRTEKGEQKVFKLDAEAMSKEKNAKPFEIQAEDTITVGEKII